MNASTSSAPAPAAVVTGAGSGVGRAVVLKLAAEGWRVALVGRRRAALDETIAHACGSPGGGCQFMGTAATSQFVAEALGLALPHAALSPSGAAIWRDLARRSAHTLLALERAGTTARDILTDEAVHNAMVVHAAFGGSTNLVLHVPAIAHAAGLRRPQVDDWVRVNRAVRRPDRAAARAGRGGGAGTCRAPHRTASQVGRALVAQRLHLQPLTNSPAAHRHRRSDRASRPCDP